MTHCYKRVSSGVLVDLQVIFTHLDQIHIFRPKADALAGQKPGKESVKMQKVFLLPSVGIL